MTTCTWDGIEHGAVFIAKESVIIDVWALNAQQGSVIRITLLTTYECKAYSASYHMAHYS